MHDQMTQSEQIKWVFAETGRMLIAPIDATWRALMEAIYDIPRSIAQARENREKLENLSDETLLDRMLIAPIHIPVISTDQPQRIPVRVIIRRALSIDGILAR